MSPAPSPGPFIPLEFPVYTAFTYTTQRTLGINLQRLSLLMHGLSSSKRSHSGLTDRDSWLRALNRTLARHALSRPTPVTGILGATDTLYRGSTLVLPMASKPACESDGQSLPEHRIWFPVSVHFQTTSALPSIGKNPMLTTVTSSSGSHQCEMPGQWRVSQQVSQTLVDCGSCLLRSQSLASVLSASKQTMHQARSVRAAMSSMLLVNKLQLPVVTPPAQFAVMITPSTHANPFLLDRPGSTHLLQPRTHADLAHRDRQTSLLLGHRRTLYFLYFPLRWCLPSFPPPYPLPLNRVTTHIVESVSFVPVQGRLALASCRSPTPLLCRPSRPPVGLPCPTLQGLRPQNQGTTHTVECASLVLIRRGLPLPPPRFVAHPPAVGHPPPGVLAIGSASGGLLRAWIRHLPTYLSLLPLRWREIKSAGCSLVGERRTHPRPRAGPHVPLSHVRPIG